MIAFAALLERLIYTPSRNARLALLQRFFETEPDPDRGYGLAALTGNLSFATAKPGLIRALAGQRVDPELFALSYDYVGDLAETTSLIWPTSADTMPTAPPGLAEVVTTLQSTTRIDLPQILSAWLDSSDESVRFAILKLVTGNLRVGVSARLAKVALAGLSQGRIDPDEIEEVWHGLTPPYRTLFAWIEGQGARPDPAGAPVFRPPMLAHPLEQPDLEALSLSEYRVEWKWDGIRVQLVSVPGGKRIFSRTGDDVSASFPDVLETMNFDGVLDGELLVARAGEVAPFSDLQQRLNRKSPGPALLKQHPAHVRLYDILFDEQERDLRALSFDERRQHLERWFAVAAPLRMDLSGLITVENAEALIALREGARAASIEGLMLKRGDSPYVPGRPRGLWWKWKRNPLTVDAVIMYAQRGHGRRSSFYSDYTFGLWRDDGNGHEELVPVGKAYHGFTDQELVLLDRWVRNHTIARFGPVREVEKSFVLEIAFDAVQRSSRHKSGIAMRFPRIARLRLDKPAAEADRLETLESMLT
ncbi:ATP-dependent DNA ligase [Granulibacter bethesdensis]|uniref:DNA ligase (ATP) n=1 Tax=Granulibacter bethesdensis TaxID=364410 RepID=A0AAC9K767_9PROT|nr:cisplatin damage response ATP-dependent DNA ligase [Granulibacter bethesdensis]APH54160.1 ATP-dependent DNA ligase [Granulibacter bethesdensis]APH61742.1 ATP-dependent DNA ligase [Granulibacter bethesdensis]